MMGAASLPTPQGSAPAGFAAFLATIGQTPVGGGDDGGFDQLLAAAPIPVAAPGNAVTPAPASNPAVQTTATATPAIPAAAPTATPILANPAATPAPPTAIPAIPAAVVAAPPVAATVAAPPTLAKPVTPTLDTPAAAGKAVETDAVDPDGAAASAAKLLIAVNGNTPTPQPKIVKTAEPKTESDADSAPVSAPIAVAVADVSVVAASPAEAPAPAAPIVTAATAAPESSATPAAVVAAAPVVVAIIAPPVGKPAKTAEAATPTREPAPVADVTPVITPTSQPRPVVAKPDAPMVETAPVAAPVTSKAHTTLALAVAGTEAPTAKRADAAPSMTIQFAQPAAPGATPIASAAQPAPIAERVLDLASNGAWIDQLAHDIAAAKSDSGDISFRLMPRHLGRLDVAMRMNDEGVSLKLDTQHEAAATIVTAAQGRLVEDLRQQGVRVTGSEVTHTPGEAGRQMQGQSQGQGRAAAQDTAHLIETASERSDARAKTDSDDAATDRRGRFA